jgi:hypothetical protein
MRKQESGLEEHWQPSRMTVDTFANALRSPAIELIGKGWYENEFSQMGYWARYRLDGCWYWFSVSNTDVEIAPDEVAAAITCADRNILREGIFPNKKGNVGFESTVKCAEHHYMLAANRTR